MSNNLKRFFTIFLLVVSFSNILPQTFLTADCSWTDLKFPFSSANTLYYDKQADDIYAAVLGGVYKLNSSNLSWTQMGTNPNNGIRPNANIISLYIDNSNVFYAGCDASTNSWISFDRGNRWQQIQDPLFMQPDSINHLKMTAFYEYKNGAVIIGTDAGLFLTTDHGRTFKKAITPANYINVITGDQSENIFLGTASGLFRSKDTCKTWSRMNVVLPGDNVNSISFDSKGNTYETSTYDLSVSTDHGDTWTSWKSKLVAPGDIFMVHWIILDKDIIYLYGTYIGLIFSQDMGNSWKQISTRWRDSTGTTIGFNPNGIYIDSKSYIYTRDASYVTIHKVYRGSITPTAVETNNTIIEPTEFRLYQNYPNPFNPSTTIKYSIPVDPATAGRHAVSLQVYDLLGREIATLVNGEKSPGNYEVKLDGTGFTSGVYFYTLRVGDFVQTKKMMLIK